MPENAMNTRQDTAALEDLQRKLHRRARRLGAQHSDAEDMAQEAVLRLLQRMLRGPLEAPEHYAMTILHNIARARWRARIETTELEEVTALTQPLAESRLALATLRRAICALPPNQAQVMEMIVQGEFSPRTIALHLGLPQGTVMSRLARARRTLRSVLGMETDSPVSELL